MEVLWSQLEGVMGQEEGKEGDREEEGEEDGEEEEEGEDEEGADAVAGERERRK